MSPAATVERARRLLARPGAWIDALTGGYGLRVGRDRRTRLLLTVDEAAFRQLTEEPGLKARPGGGWMARTLPFPSPDASPAARPGVIEGVRAVVEDKGALTLKRANLGHSAIAWLARRRDAEGRPWLNAVEVAAADLLVRDAEAALCESSVTMRWDALPRAGSGGGAAWQAGPGDGAMAAGRRVGAALAACGPSRGIVEAICIRCSALQAAERDLGLGRRNGKALLRTGLAALANHYRIG